MNDVGRLIWLTVGLVLGALTVGFFMVQEKPAQAANDRFEDYVMCTGPVAVSARTPTDGVWLLDYRSGKLLGTVIDRAQGKLVGWAETDLVQEFGIPPRQNVHSQGQAALYVAETTTGKFGVYTMGPREDGQAGVMIRRHDLVMFRQAAKNN
jgi:hypothetical protein